MYDSILVPTDGSMQAMNAVERGVQLAAKLGATLHVIYVIDEFEGKIVPITKEQDEKRAEYEAYGEEVTGEVAEMAEQAGVDCVTAVLDGVTSREIVDYAEDNDIDMVVMGSRGRTNLEAALMGSVTDRVVRKLDVPVTIVHEPPTDSMDWMVRSGESVHG
jgi:nucleotide-binding universal stress UspA family protein